MVGTTSYADLHAESWQVNTNGHTNALFSSTTDITTSAEDTSGTAWKVTHPRIPNYDQIFTQTQVDQLNSRPKASSDFTNGATTAAAGDAIVWGEDIGYSQANGCNGYWPPGPACPTVDDIAMTFSYTPSDESSTDGCYIGLGAAGYFVNGASLYGLSDGLSYNSEGNFINLAAKFEPYDLDICNGHAANGDYHHHHYPICLQNALGDTGSGHSPIYGWIFDSYPIYGPFQSAGQVAIPSWEKRDYSAGSATGCANGGRSCVLNDQFDYTQGTNTVSSGPAFNSTVTTQSGNTISSDNGIFYEDYFYNSSLYSHKIANGHGEYLDEYNGHTHEPMGYHYHITIAKDQGEAVFPFIIGPKFKGCLSAETASESARKLHTQLRSTEHAARAEVEGNLRTGARKLQPPPPGSTTTCCSAINVGQCTGVSTCAASPVASPTFAPSTTARGCTYGKLSSNGNTIKQPYSYKKPHKYDDCPAELVYDAACVPVTDDDVTASIKYQQLSLKASNGGKFKINHKRTATFNKETRYGEFIMDACKTANDELLDIFAFNHYDGLHVTATVRDSKGKVRNSMTETATQGMDHTCGGQAFHSDTSIKFNCISGISDK